MDRLIIHVDMDAFYASVEIRDNPSLKGRPLIIGSLPSERGVVATCSYEARKYGVRSGMNIKEAYRLCPGGIYMHPDMEKYREVSLKLREIWREKASAMETIALDEAYLDVTEQAKDLQGARRIARRIKERTKAETGLTCSVGLAYSKTAAKTASEEKKPDGYFEIPSPADFVDLIIDRDVRVLYTVGEKTAARLHDAGIRTVRELREREDQVIRLLGKQGRWLIRLASGVDDRQVVPYRPQDARSISREVTFQEDVKDFSLLRDILVLLALCVKHRADRVGRLGNGVTLKLTYGNMKAITRSRLTYSCDYASDIYRTAAEMLEQVEKGPVRLIGLGLYNLSSGEEGRQVSVEELLEDLPAQRQRELERLLAGLKSRYGLDFAAHLEDIYRIGTLHRTVEYMRKNPGEREP